MFAFNDNCLLFEQFVSDVPAENAKFKENISGFLGGETDQLDYLTTCVSGDGKITEKLGINTSFGEFDTMFGEFNKIDELRD